MADAFDFTKEALGDSKRPVIPATREEATIGAPTMDRGPRVGAAEIAQRGREGVVPEDMTIERSGRGARLDEMEVVRGKQTPQQVAQQYLTERGRRAATAAKGVSDAGAYLQGKRPEEPRQAAQSNPYEHVPVIHTDTYTKFVDYMNQLFGSGGK